MSSYIMHISISDIVKKKLNLTDKFIYGSVLPDVLKKITGDRLGTHYTEKIIIAGETRNLPRIYKAISDLSIQDKEIRLGYIAHLVEDLIWFNEYIPTYISKVEDNRIKYLHDESTHTSQEFTQDIYSDYINSSEYVINKCNVDIDKLKTSLEGIIQDKQHLEVLKANIRYINNADLSNNTFMTKDSIDKYIEQSAKEVEKIVLKLLGE